MRTTLFALVLFSGPLAAADPHTFRGRTAEQWAGLLSDAKLRFEAAGALVQLAPHDKTALSAMEKALRQGPEPAREAVIGVLAGENTGAVRRQLAPALVTAAKGKAFSEVARLLVTLDPPPGGTGSLLAEVIAGNDAERRGQAMYQAQELRGAKETVPVVAALRKLLADKEVRSFVLETLTKLAVNGADLGPVVTDLVALTKDDEARPAALTALRRAGPKAKDAFGPLSDLLKTSVEKGDGEAAKRIGLALSASNPDRVPTLLPLLLNVPEERRDWAAGAASGLGPALVPGLRLALKDEKARARAIVLLGALGPHARPAARELAALSDVESADAIHVFFAMRPLEGPELLVLLDALKAAPKHRHREAILSMIVSPSGYQNSYPVEPGPGLLPAIPALADALRRHPDAGVRKALVELFRLSGSMSASALPALREALGDSDVDVAFAAAETLFTREGGPTPELIAFVNAQLKHADVARRRRAVERANSFAEKVRPALLTAANDDDAEVRRAAVNALGTGNDGENIPTLLRAVKDPSEDVRSIALYYLGTCPKPPEAALDAFLAELNKEDPSTRVAAMRGIAKMGAGGKKAAPTLMALLKDKDATVTFAAAEALAHTGGADAATLLPLLRPKLDVLELETAHRAAAALGALGAAAAPAAFDLARQMGREDGGWGYSLAPFAEALTRIGPAAKTVAPCLLVERRHWNARDRIARAYVQAGGDRRTGGLHWLLHDFPQFDYWDSSLDLIEETLNQLAGDEAEAVLVEVLKEPVARKRLLAADLLARRGRDKAALALPVYREVARSTDNVLAWRGLLALQTLAPDEARKEVAVLGRLLKARGLADSREIVVLAELFGPTTAPLLADALRKPVTSDQAIWGVLHILEALGRMGPEAATALNAVRPLMKSEYAMVRVAAADALTRIDPKEAAAAIPVLRAALRDLSAEGGTQAVAALARLLPDDAALPGEVIALVETGRVGPKALWPLGSRARAAVPLLVRLLDDDSLDRGSLAFSPYRRRAADAAWLLLDLEPKHARRAAGVLLEMGNNGATLYYAGWSDLVLDPASLRPGVEPRVLLGRVQLDWRDFEGQPAVFVLAPLLAHRDRLVREAATRNARDFWLGLAGAQGVGLSERLTRIVADGDRAVKLRAALGWPVPEPGLAASLKQIEPLVEAHRLTAGLQGHAGGEWNLDAVTVARAKAALPKLLALLKADDPFVRQQALRGLGRIAPLVLGDTAAVVPLLDDPDAGVRGDAAVLLSAIVPGKAGAALPRLLSDLRQARGEEERQRLAAAVAAVATATGKSVDARSVPRWRELPIESLRRMDPQAAHELAD